MKLPMRAASRMAATTCSAGSSGPRVSALATPCSMARESAQQAWRDCRPSHPLQAQALQTLACPGCCRCRACWSSTLLFDWQPAMHHPHTHLGAGSTPDKGGAGGLALTPPLTSEAAMSALTPVTSSMCICCMPELNTCARRSKMVGDKMRDSQRRSHEAGPWRLSQHTHQEELHERYAHSYHKLYHTGCHGQLFQPGHAEGRHCVCCVKLARTNCSCVSGRTCVTEQA